MKSRKKYLLVFIMIICVFSMLFVFSSCNNQTQPISNFYDLDKIQLDNVLEAGYVGVINGETSYYPGNKPVYAVKKGDDRLKPIVDAWTVLVKNAQVTPTNKNRKPFQTGSDISYALVFNDETSIFITKIVESKDSIVVMIKNDRYLIDKEDFEAFVSAYDSIDEENDIYK